MTPMQLEALMPLIILSASVVIIMLVIAFHRNHLLTLFLTLTGLGLSFISIPLVAHTLPQQVTSLLVIDSYSEFFIGLIILSSFAVALLAFDYFDKHSSTPEEFYIILLLATLGSCVLTASSHFVSFFLGLEILSVSLYAMSAYLCDRKQPLEAGIKYLVLAAASASRIRNNWRP